MEVTVKQRIVSGPNKSKRCWNAHLATRPGRGDQLLIVFYYEDKQDAGRQGDPRISENSIESVEEIVILK